MSTPETRHPAWLHSLDPARWREVERILDVALELDFARIPAYLDTSCASDAELRRAVETLLHAAFASEQTLDRSFEGLRRDLFIAKRNVPGEQVHDAFCISGDVLLRLEPPQVAQLLESEPHLNEGLGVALAPLSAPSIVEHCQREVRNLDDALETFDDLCSAVQFLHRRGFCHGELRPGNILIDRGDTKLRESGIEELLFAYACKFRRPASPRPGPEYLAPELLHGEPPTRAGDIWSLGVLLFKLVTGHRPFSLGGIGDVPQYRAIVEVEPPPASVVAREGSRESESVRWAPRLSGDLDRVISRTLSKDPGLRQETVDALASDLRRFWKASAWPPF